jgi:hypothetical protein
VSDWRRYGDVPLDTWRHELATFGSPLAAEPTATWEAARPHSALALAMAFHESRYGTSYRRNTADNRNVHNLRPRGGFGFQTFPTWEAGVAEWRDRLTDPNYAYARTVTVADLVSVFAPSSDDNDEAGYVRVVEWLLDEWPREGWMSTPQPLPAIVLTAGHRSDADTGNPAEKARTPLLAQAYKRAFEAAGFTVYYWQSMDGDTRPDQSPGGLDGVGRGVGRLMSSIGGPSILFDLHFEGGGPRGVFSIVPDVTGLRTAVSGGAPIDDTWARNGDDVALARLVSRYIGEATGLPLRSTTEPGVMSERVTGVGGQGWRLGMMAYTAAVRARSPRLVVEHGCLTQTADLKIIDSPGFYDKCAAAALRAVRERYGVPVVPPAPVYVDPGPFPAEAGKDADLGGARFYACAREVRAGEGARFREYADVTSRETRAPAKPGGEGFAVAWAVQGTAGEWWWVTPRGSRIRCTDTDVRVAFSRA